MSMSQQTPRENSQLVAPPDSAAPGGVRAGQAGRSLWGDARRRLLRDRSSRLCLLVITFYALLALGGGVYDLLAEHDVAGIPTFGQTADFDQAYQPPSWSLRNLLGTDWSGKSVLAKTILGAKVSLTVGFMANVIAVPLGLILGAIAGYYGKFIDDVIVWLYSTLASIPGIILLIAMKYAFKGVKVLGLDLTGIHGLYIALGIISWVGTCRLVRAEVMKIRELDYVLAARATGQNSLLILLKHVLPNVMHIAVINFSLGFVGAVASEVTLSYLGLGVAVGTPSWGTMINSARMDLFAGRWWELTSAVGAMFFLVLALNIFGDRLRDALDPRLRTA
jgi:peptide/nickel transport system permease protein